MKARNRVALLLWGALAGAACGAGGDSAEGEASGPDRVERTDSGGVELLTWTAETLPDPVPGTDGTERLRIAPTGPGWALDGVTGIAAGEDGSVVVANRGDGFLLRFEADGSLRGRSGGLGEGPGEFTALFGVEPRGDTLHALDFLPRRVAVFGPDGALVRTVTLEAAGVRPLELWPVEGGYLSVGPTTVGEVSEELRSAQRRAEVSRWSAEGRHEGVIADLPGMEVWFQGIETDQGAVMTMVSPIVSHRDREAFTGRWLVTAHTAAAHLDVRRTDGTLVRQIRIPALERPSTDVAWQALVDARMADAETPGARQIVRDLAEGPRPATLPAFGRLLPDGETRVWVALPDDAAAGGPTEPRWAVVDLETGELQVVALPAGFTLRRITPDRLLGVERDAFDVESVVGYGR